ncbi:hypothetical protein ABPG74_010684 [Tetrahymena malaccensis]
MNYQSARIRAQNNISLQQKSNTSRVFSHKSSIENIPIQILQQQINTNQSPHFKQNKSQYSFMDTIQNTKSNKVYRQGQSSLTSLNILQNADSKRNSFCLQQPQVYPIKILENKSHHKNQSHYSPLQSQNILSQTPSNQSFIIRNESNENIDGLNVSKERGTNCNQSVIIKDLENKVEILENQIREQSGISGEYKSKYEALQKIVESQMSQIQLQQSQNKDLQQEIQKLQDMISEKDKQYATKQNEQQLQIIKVEEHEAVKLERDELIKTMNKIMKSVEKVLQENQQLNELALEASKQKQLCTNLQEELNQKEKQLQQFNQHIEALKENLFKELKFLQSEKDQQTQEIEKLKNLLLIQKEQNQVINLEITKMKSQKQFMEINMPKILDQNEDLQAKIETCEERINTLEKLKEGLEQENQNLVLQVKEQQEKQDDEIIKQIDDLELRILDLVQENQSLRYLLQQQINAQQAKIDSYI